MIKLSNSLKLGLSFGITSGIITTLGLIIGLNAGTHSEKIVIAGILTIAITDASSDALGIFFSEESENEHSNLVLFQSMISTWLAKFFIALSFLIPVLIWSLPTAIIICIIWGLLVLGLLSSYIAKINHKNLVWSIAGHLSVAMIVIIITRFIGDWISRTIG